MYGRYKVGGFCFCFCFCGIKGVVVVGGMTSAGIRSVGVGAVVVTDLEGHIYEPPDKKYEGFTQIIHENQSHHYYLLTSFLARAAAAFSASVWCFSPIWVVWIVGGAWEGWVDGFFFSFLSFF